MILIAPTAFKGSHSAAEAADAMANAFSADRTCVLPLSDGGPGLIDALMHEAVDLTHHRVRGPLGDTVRARLLWLPDAAVIESADAVGLHLIEPQLDPMRADSYGLGELLRIAAERGAEEIIVGLGGSASVDAGTGMLRALGWTWLDIEDEALPPGGGSLERLHSVRPPVFPWIVPITALADVTTPIVGPENAARIFGPQKGATPEQVLTLERGLRRFDAVVHKHLGISLGGLPGGGAAGGLGAALAGLLGARLAGGSNWLLDRIGFDEHLARAELLITGEGAFDAQSALGKITGVVIERARARGVPVLLIAGRIEGELPASVHGASGSGAVLGLDDLQRLAERESARLLAP